VGHRRLTRMVAGFCAQPQCLGIFHGTDVPVSPARQRFDVARFLNRIAQYFANAGNCVVNAMIEIDEGISRPDLTLKFFASHDVASSFHQYREDLQWLASQV